MTKDSVPGTSRCERYLTLIEDAPWCALYRMMIGYGTQPLYTRFVGGDASGWWMWLWFLSLLLALRLGPAVVRMALPFSEGVNVIWAERRRMAKRFDSYQWRKLLWFGIGLAVYVAISRSVMKPGIALAVFCLVGGGLGEIAWRRRSQASATTPRS